MAYAAARAVDNRRMQEQSRADVEDFVRRHRKDVFRLALMVMGDREEAEDLTQEVFLRAARCGHSLASLDQPLAWLRKILLRRAFTRLKQRRPMAALAEEASGDSGLGEQ